MPITITFPGGTPITGATAAEVFEEWRSNPWNSDLNDEEFREEVVKRAYVWSGAIVDSRLPLDELLDELTKARLFVLERSW